MNSEEKEKLQAIIKVLKKTAEKFRSLHKLAQVELYSGYASFSRQRLEEAARLLIDLQSIIFFEALELDPKIIPRILTDVSWFSRCAKDAIKDKETFRLEILLSFPWDNVEDENALERLISFLEEKLQ